MPTACEFRLPPAPAHGEVPLAVMRDIAAGPTEYLVGVPGGPVVVLTQSTGFSPPQLAGASIFFSRRRGTNSSVYLGSMGGCAHRVVDGTLGAVEPGGRAFSVLVNSHWLLYDAAGHRVSQLTGASGSWTRDGHLVEPTAAGIDVFDLAGKHRSMPLAGAAPLGALGNHQELVSTASGIQVLDIVTGGMTPLNAGAKLIRAPGGSPDGTRVAFLDANGVGQVLELATGKTRALPAPALTTGFAWSHDSAWIGVQSTYGGAELRLADGRVVDSGSLVVVSW
ncbi:MAG: hypothetical protein QOK05_1207 [Chloroflexota bacterium]|nr:hypothetical protein [Chloroflexota bacterium]